MMMGRYCPTRKRVKRYESIWGKRSAGDHLSEATKRWMRLSLWRWSERVGTERAISERVRWPSGMRRMPRAMMARLRWRVRRKPWHSDRHSMPQDKEQDLAVS